MNLPTPAPPVLSSNTAFTSTAGCLKDKEATPASASEAATVVDLRDYHDRIPTAAARSSNASVTRAYMARSVAAEASLLRKATTSKRLSLYSDLGSDSSECSSDGSADGGGGGDGGLTVRSNSDASSVWTLRGFPQFTTDGSTNNGGVRGVVGGANGDGGDGGDGGVHEQPVSRNGEGKTGWHPTEACARMRLNSLLH